MAIPYAGVNYLLFVDHIGPAGYPSLTIGVRSYPFGLLNRKKAAPEPVVVQTPPPEEPKPTPEPVVQTPPPAEPKPAPEPEPAKPLGPPSMQISMQNAEFTPDGDGEDDSAVFLIKQENMPEIDKWLLEVRDSKNNLFKTFAGADSLPGSIEWDGYSDQNERVLSANTYKAKLMTQPKNQEALTSTIAFNVGILVDKMSDGTMRISVNSIYFDPDAATFKKITAEQLESNKKTLSDVAKQILKYPDYDIVVEGHANNISGTKEEEVKELIPLSRQRAEKIMHELNDLGVPLERMSAVGKGGSEPLAAREDRTQWWKNRRVEFLLKK